MPSSASIDIELFLSAENIRVVDIINKFISYGWALNDNGQMSYLPLGDEDNFNWIRAELNKESLMNILVQKETQKEIIGIVMTWKDTGIGGEFLFWADGDISINLNVT